MNISVYFYDEEGRYTHMDMTPLEFDSEGVQILPENSTAIYPPDLSTDPRFSEELGKWIEQIPVEPYSSNQVKEDIESLKAELNTTIRAIRDEQGKHREAIKRLAYYNSVESVNMKSIYDAMANGNF